MHTRNKAPSRAVCVCAAVRAVTGLWFDILLYQAYRDHGRAAQNSTEQQSHTSAVLAISTHSGSAKAAEIYKRTKKESKASGEMNFYHKMSIFGVLCSVCLCFSLYNEERLVSLRQTLLGEKIINERLYDGYDLFILYKDIQLT